MPIRYSADAVFTIEGEFYVAHGHINITDDIRGPLETTLVTYRCEKVGQCNANPTITNIPSTCGFLVRLPFSEIGAGHYFTPQIRCPIKSGVYEVNMNVSLNGFEVFPLDTRILYKSRTLIYQVMQTKRKRKIVCHESYVRILPFTSRPRKN